MQRSIRVHTRTVSAPMRSRARAEVLRLEQLARNAGLRAHPGRHLLKGGRRAMVWRSRGLGRQHVTKQFRQTGAGLESLRVERLAQLVFADQPWILRARSGRRRRQITPALPAEARLDRVAPSLSDDERRAVAGQALSIALDIYTEGYAHRDLHPGNLYLIDGSLVLADFETLTPVARRPPFEQSYDVTGVGLPSPHKTHHMGYASTSKKSLESVLGVSLNVAMDQLRGLLRDELLRASLTFQRRGAGSNSRHHCKTKVTYCSLSVPGLDVPRESCQRDSVARLDQFGLSAEVVEGCRVLDLGSNIGAMSLTLAQRGATDVLGLEYDSDKVRVARRVAAFGGIHQAEYRVGDLDHTVADDIDGTFDIVMCLAIDRHVQDVDHLYRLLGDVTSSILCFEGNAGCDTAAVERALLAVGFVDIEHLGTSTDDIRPENNVRPLIRATKRAP